MEHKIITAVGIDVSKYKSMVAVRRPGGEIVMGPFEVRHTAAELDELVSKLAALDGEVRVVMEAHGDVLAACSYGAEACGLLRQRGQCHAHTPLQR